MIACLPDKSYNTILVVNALNGMLPLVLRDAFPQARIVCGEVFPYFRTHLASLGFEVQDWEAIDMKFDLVIGNPPYNEASASEKTIAGTSGNTTLYRKFIDKSLALGDTVALVVQRTGIRYAKKKNQGLAAYCLDTNRHWSFTAGWFVANASDHGEINHSHDAILRKVYNLDEQWRYSSAIGGSYQSNEGKSYWKEPAEDRVQAVVEVPGAKNPQVIRAWVKGTNRTGPHLLFKGLESRHSYIVVNEPSKAGSTCALFFDTVDEAEKARVFILNNPVVEYVKNITNEKTLGMVFRFLKKFDLSQVVTGKEIPREWNLTTKDLKIIQTSGIKI